MHKRDSYRGALVGVLAGDALLAPYETWSALRVQVDLAERGGLVPFDYPNPWSRTTPPAILPMGRPTDDADQTAALAESLVACRGLVQVDLFNRLRNVTFGHVSPLWSGKAMGAGKTTLDALRPTTFAESQKRDVSGAFPSNGALMRTAPLALFFGSYENFDPVIVSSAAHVTHAHWFAKTTCVYYVGVLIGFLNGHDLRSAKEKSCAFLSHTELTMLHLETSTAPFDPGKWPGRGAAALTLNIALHTLEHAKDFEEGLTKVAMIGGDTDTYGAVAGGWLGAKFGLDGIPANWQAVLKGRDKMIDLADALYDIAHS